MSRIAFIAFLSVSAVHLTTLLVGLDASISKFFLMPTLALWVWSLRGPKIIVAALIASAVGDIALEFDGLFLVGMAGFALAHVLYVSYFMRAGALGNKTRLTVIGVPVAIAATALVFVVWPRLPDLQIPIAIYAALLAATAVTSYAVNTTAGLGGVLFLGSDSILALRMADLPHPEPGSLWIMVPYILGQFLLAFGAMAVQEREIPNQPNATTEH